MIDFPLVMVEWEDHTSSSSWKSKTDYPKAPIAVVRTIGWKVYEDRKKMVIHNSIILGDDEDTGGESVILKKVLVKEWEIEIG